MAKIRFFPEDDGLPAGLDRPLWRSGTAEPEGDPLGLEPGTGSTPDAEDDPTLADGPAEATAYEGTGSWLRDLAREIQAAIGLARCRRELQDGSRHHSAFRAIRLDEDQVAILARGGLLKVGEAQLALATIAARGEVPVGTWQLLAEHSRRWRLARSVLSADEHPSRSFATAVEGLPLFLERCAALLVLSSLMDCLEATLARSGIRVRGGLNIRDCYRALGDEAEGWMHSGYELVFADDGPLAERGIIEVGVVEDADGNDLDRIIQPDRGFLDDCLGRDLAAVARMPGVQVIHPAERLEDVVLTADQRRVAEGLLAGWPWLTGSPVALGVLLHGPSGTGKTMLARGLAGSAGRPLLLIDGDLVAASDRERDVVTSLLRRAAREKAILFIDEASQVVPNGSAASRALLVHLDRIPAAVILATNNALAFDPALDRRLLVKLALPMPGPKERGRILQRELRVQGHRLAEGLLMDQEVARMAESIRLSGGYWRNVVQLAGMLADQRAGGSGPLNADDLADAIRRQVGEESSPLANHAQHIHWSDPDAPQVAVVLGERVMAQTDAMIAALDHLRAERAAEDLHGIGACVVIHGPERHLVGAVTARMAQRLRLPLGWIRQRAQMLIRPVVDQDEGDEDLFHEEPDAGNWVAAHAAPRAIRRQGVGRFGALRFDTDALAELDEELGELAIVGLRLPSPEAALAWIPIIDHLAASQHLLVIHQLDGAIPPELTRRAAAICPWARVDASMRSAGWQRLGGRGPAPTANCLGELAAAAARQRLRRGGLPASEPLTRLP